MTTDPQAPPVGRGFRRRSWRVITVLITAFVAVGAYYGSWYLISGRADSELTFKAPEFLPGDGWAAGGWALLVIVAAPMTVAALSTAGGSRAAPTTAIVAGALLIAWILVQVAVIGLVSFLQPLMLGFAVLVLALGLWGRR